MVGHFEQPVDPKVPFFDCGFSRRESAIDYKEVNAREDGTWSTPFQVLGGVSDDLHRGEKRRCARIVRAYVASIQVKTSMQPSVKAGCEIILSTQRLRDSYAARQKSGTSRSFGLAGLYAEGFRPKRLRIHGSNGLKNLR
jgi:hypothetical protein